MATQNELLAKSAGASLISGMSRLLEDIDTADITVTCGEKEWRLHTAILAIRSPFFKEAIANVKEGNLEMKIDIENLDHNGMQEVINFMYGKPIGKAPFSALLEASERFQMDDMKKVVINIGSESINSETALEIGKLAELYNIEQLLQESAEFIVNKPIEIKEEDVTPKLTIRIFSIFRKALEDSRIGSSTSPFPKSTTPDGFLTNLASASLISAMSVLLEDTDTADFTVTCEGKEWRLHSPILSIRSPFFKGAIANTMAEKLEMKMEIKDLDPEGMQEVINFMYGKPIGKAPFGALLEAAERFQMDDMKQDVIEIGSKSITPNSVLDIGKLAELYNIDSLLQETAEFIVANEIDIKEDDVTPKLTARALSIFKNALKDSNQKEKELIQTNISKEAEIQREFNVKIENIQHEFNVKIENIRERIRELRQYANYSMEERIDDLLRTVHRRNGLLSHYYLCY